MNSIIVTLEEVREAAMRFPNMPVQKALELNRHMRDNVAAMLRESGLI